jgi:hypothetical protein
MIEKKTEYAKEKKKFIKMRNYQRIREKDEAKREQFSSFFLILIKCIFIIDVLV